MQISGKTKLFGIVGYPVGHSLSPAMHNKAFELLQLDHCYLPLPLEPPDLPKGVAGLRALGFAGFNVTIPHKEAVLQFLDEVDPEAAGMGAVNTVLNRDGRLIGFNTDGRGFLRSVSELWDFTPAGRNIVILGAGGAARAIAAALAAAGAQSVTIANRNPERAKKLAQALGDRFPCRFSGVGLEVRELDLALEQSSLVVNTTPVGMYPQVDSEPPINPARLFTHNFVCDTIFNPWETRLLREAKSKGCTTANGLGMLLHQGTLAFELWTGKPAPVEAMREALLAAVSPSHVTDGAIKG